VISSYFDKTVRVFWFLYSAEFFGKFMLLIFKVIV